MARREFLALGKVFNPEKHKIGGYYISEKLDGVRVFWDGGLTRGRPTVSVPWAGIINPKTGQQKDKIRPTASGLWSRYGNPISAPDWFLNQLPPIPIDGELFAGRGKFQKTVSYVKKEEPVDAEWENINFLAFSCPSLWSVMQTGEIKNAQMVCNLVREDIEAYVRSIATPDWQHLTAPSFESELANLNAYLDSTNEVLELVQQTKLPLDHDEALDVAMRRMHDVTSVGGEGIIIRNPAATWTPKRTADILKGKQVLDAEGTVVGFTSGRKTDKGSKLLGKIGALILDFNGKRLELSGLTDEERLFATDGGLCYAESYPGIDMPDNFEGKHFKRGDRVSFIYRELSDDGIPKEARYYRMRPDE